MSLNAIKSYYYTNHTRVNNLLLYVFSIGLFFYFPYLSIISLGIYQLYFNTQIEYNVDLKFNSLNKHFNNSKIMPDYYMNEYNKRRKIDNLVPEKTSNNIKTSVLESENKILPELQNFGDVLESENKILPELQNFGDVLESENNILPESQNFGDVLESENNILPESQNFGDVLESENNISEEFQNFGDVLESENKISEEFQNSEDDFIDGPALTILKQINEELTQSKLYNSPETDSNQSKLFNSPEIDSNQSKLFNSSENKTKLNGSSIIYSSDSESESSIHWDDDNIIKNESLRQKLDKISSSIDNDMKIKNNLSLKERLERVPQ